MAPRRVNLDDLLGTDEIADLLGLSSPRSVSTYISRFPDFPGPVLTRNSGRCQLWLRQEILRWLKRHPGLGRNSDPT